MKPLCVPGPSEPWCVGRFIPNFNVFFLVTIYPSRTCVRHQVGYLWPQDSPGTKATLLASLAFLVVGKVLNAQVPFVLQRAVDGMAAAGGTSTVRSAGALAPLALFALYGWSRVATVAFNELKTMTFAHVSQAR